MPQEKKIKSFSAIGYIRAMNYAEALDFLYGNLPMYQNMGKTAFKKDLTNTIRLCEGMNNPQYAFKSVHVGGTNGKGSSSHMLASVLQEAGYKTGLYTSPHLKDFTERIRVNGQPISEENVIGFVEDHHTLIQEIEPSFFEMTVVMAFDYFRREKVDVAIIEVGLGGRLDSTNVIIPEVALITNIGYDHMDMLGNTLELIAGEKAGIIKPQVSVIIGTTQPETQEVFSRTARERNAPLTFADQQDWNREAYPPDLKGNYQKQNLPGVLSTIKELQEQGWTVTDKNISKGLSQVVANTGLKGRWQTLSESPLTICDTGHNVNGVELIVEQLQQLTYKRLFLVLGFVNDKNIAEILTLFPSDAQYIFCQSKVPRAMPLATLMTTAMEIGIEGVAVTDVNEALQVARQQAGPNDLIFVGGSTFVVAELEEL